MFTSKISFLLRKREEMVAKAAELADGEARLRALLSDSEDHSTESLLAWWAMDTMDEAPEHPVLRAIADARSRSISLEMEWTEQAARAVVRQVLSKHPDVPLPEGFEGQVYPEIGHLQRQVSDLRRWLNTAKGSLSADKAEARAALEQERYERQNPWYRWTCLAAGPPVLGALPETHEVGSQRGWRTAPAQLLLAVAYGLATGEHWWLISPKERSSFQELQEYPHGYPPQVETWGPVLSAYEEKAGDQYRPNVAFYGQSAQRVARVRDLVRDKNVRDRGARGSSKLRKRLEATVPVDHVHELRWQPLMNGEELNLHLNHSRKVVIRVEPGASTGTIEWCTGKWMELGEGWTCSSFIGSILAVLPEAEDDGSIASMFEAEDCLAARRIASILAAKEAGVTGAIKHLETGDQIASAVEVAREMEYHLHLGYQPRRCWTLGGEEKRLGRWLQRDEFKKLVERVEPLPWSLE